MKNLISRVEAEELCNGLVLQYLGKDLPIPSCIDIDDFVKSFLHCNIVYENIAEDDRDRIGFTSDGKREIHVMRKGKIVSIVYPKNTIVLDKYLLNRNEEYHRRFILGHEAGHVLANKVNPVSAGCFYNFANKNYVNYSIDYMRERYSINEWQANMFAAALLMPRFLMMKTLKKYNGGRRLPVYGENIFHPREKAIINKMMRALQVSYTALVIRLKELGMLSHHEISEYIQMELGLGGK